MHRSGVRALRFIEAGEGVPNFAGAVGFAALPAIAPRIRALGWHLQVWAPCETIAAAGANLIDVAHVREGVDLHVRETGVQLVLETRGREDAARVLAAVRDAGYDAQAGSPSGVV